MNEKITIEQAIKLLEELHEFGNMAFDTENEKIFDALKMAIAALRDEVPDWNRAPEWARWRGRNCNGEFVYYEDKPNLTYHGFHSTSGKKQFDFREYWVKLWQRPAE